MKTEFFWQWSDKNPAPDILMTRARAAKLLRAWRRRSGTWGGYPAYSAHKLTLTRKGVGVYRIENCYGESGALIVRAERCPFEGMRKFSPRIAQGE